VSLSWQRIKPFLSKAICVQLLEYGQTNLKLRDKYHGILGAVVKAVLSWHFVKSVPIEELFR
jgi:hypothetical protein